MSSSLLDRMQALMEVERSLTATLEKVEPWLLSSTLNNNNNTTNTTQGGGRVRPIPSTMEQVHQVLAVSRNYASRTSAPAGWNPQAPVVGFSTPNPLPHQLRGGALAALQLERARQEEKRKRQQAQEEELAAAKQANKMMKLEQDGDEDGGDGGDGTKTPRSHNLTIQTGANVPAGNKAANPNAKMTTSGPGSPSLKRRQQQITPKPVATTMNLSDSSSSEEESDDDDEEEEE